MILCHTKFGELPKIVKYDKLTSASYGRGINGV